MSRIAHMSDIHIRINSRHKEYREVFEKVYAMLLRENIDRIVLAGDVVHSKNRMSPELTELTAEFISRLAKIAPLDIIPGNHDTIISNRDRLDALTPIVDLARLDTSLNEINYFTTTGLHEIDGTDIVYGVWSVLDSNILRLKEIEKKKDKTYIGLYHAPVWGCVTDVNYAMTDDTITPISIFNNFDIVMLGDIHKYQTFREDSTAAYCGSLIQQNFGESLDKGFVIWDTEKKTHERIIVPNDYGFYTMYLDESLEIPALDNVQPKCKMRVIAETDHVSKLTLSRITTEIKTKYNPRSLIVNFKPKSVDDETGKLLVSGIQDVSLLEVQQSLLKQWLDVTEVKPEIVDSVIDLDYKIYEMLENSKEAEDYTKATWAIEKLTVSNFLSYGSNETIDFKSKSGIVGLFGDNAVGKSCIFDAILYALFNKTTRDVKNVDLINKFNGATNCVVELDIVINDIEYRITRETKKRFRTRSKEYVGVRTNVEFSKFEDGKWINLSSTQRRKTERIIRNAIGEYDDFLTTTLLAQHEDSDLIGQKAGNLIESMVTILGLDVFLRKNEIASTELRDLVSKSKNVNLDEHSSMLAELVKQKHKLKSNIQSIEENRISTRESLNSISEVMSSLQSSMNKQYSVNYTLDEIKNKLQLVEADIRNKETMLASYKSTIKDIDTKCKQATKLLVSAEKIEELKQTIEKHSWCVERIVEFKQELESLTLEKQSLKSEIDLNSCPISEHLGDNSCALLDSIAKKKLRLSDVLIRIKVVESDIRASETCVLVTKPSCAMLTTQNTIKEKIESVAIIRKENETLYEKTSSTLETKRVELQLLQQKQSMIITNLEIVENNQKLAKEIELLDIKQVAISDELDKLDADRLEKTSILAVCEDNFETQTKVIESITTNQKKIAVYETYISAMNRDGIVLAVLKQYIPIINFELNKAISNIFDFGIYFKMGKTAKDMRIILNYSEGDDRPISMGSGMEMLIANIVIRSILISHSNLSKSSMLFIDEGFGVLDPENIYAVQKMLEELKDLFKNIIIITHVDAMKDLADYSILVTKDDNISKLNTDSFIL